MSFEVLARSVQNTSARAEMARRGLSLVRPWYVRAVHKTRVIKGVNIGDTRKSWDVWKSVQFVQANVHRTSPILDVGAYASEILCILYRLGFSDLTGIDLDSGLKRMPHQDAIKYVSGDFMRNSFPPGTFKAITAISVLEHGFREDEMLKETSRILAPGGYFIGSIDYWPEKIDTTGIKAFGLDWRIFSQPEVLSFVRQARSYRLFPVGELDLRASEKTISWSGRDYTFAWFVFRKAEHELSAETSS
jgi:SAM-dependent methyltransferase